MGVLVFVLLSFVPRKDHCRPIIFSPDLSVYIFLQRIWGLATKHAINGTCRNQAAE